MTTSTPEQVFSNRYETVRHLARGGMAEVYVAHDRLLDRDVALKVLFPEFARDPSFVQRFRREAQAAANLNHPNIVAVYDWGEEDGTYFIVMELVEGRTLRDLIRAEGRLSAARAADIGADVAAALSFAHRGGVVHRDVKPGNILITPHGQVKVTDFGIARAGTSEGLTQTGSVMGTATYFSPEQAQGLVVDARSDVYSLGVVLYEMVSGLPPFAGDTPVAIAYKHVREEPVPPSKHNPDLPAAFEQIVAVAMAKNPADRYATADDLRDDLARFSRGQPISASPVTALVAQVDDATATVAVSRTDHTMVGAPAAPYPAPRRRTGAFTATLVALLAVVLLLVYLLVRQLSGGGGGTIEVKDVVNRPLSEARAILEGQGFTVEPDFEQNDSVPENQVFAQDPDPGTKLKARDKVTLKVSQGPGSVAVPNVLNQPLDDARVRLEDAGLKVSVQQQPNDTVAEGLVFRSDPAPDEQAKKGSTVTVFVSTGVPKQEVPDVTNLDAGEASNQLGLAGFKVQQLSEPSESVAKGKVTRTDPAGHTQAPKGSTVKMYVSTGPEQVEVPNVKGKTEADATAELEAAGFKVDAQHFASCSPANDGKVFGQSPPGGDKAPKGSTVSIFVCKIPATTTTT